MPLEGLQQGSEVLNYVLLWLQLVPLEITATPHPRPPATSNLAENPGAKLVARVAHPASLGSAELILWARSSL